MSGIPTTYSIDKDGYIHSFGIGQLSKREFETCASRLLR